MDCEQASQRRAASTKRLIKQTKGDHIHLTAAILAWDDGPQVAHMSQALDDPPWHALLSIIAVGMRLDLCLHKRSKSLLALALLRCQFYTHVFSSHKRAIARDCPYPLTSCGCWFSFCSTRVAIALTVRKLSISRSSLETSM